jgi:hypothetical protein
MNCCDEITIEAALAAQQIASRNPRSERIGLFLKQSFGTF